MRAIKVQDYENVYSQLIPVGKQHLIVTYGDCNCKSCKRQRAEKHKISIFVIHSKAAYDDYARDSCNYPIYFKSIKQAKSYIAKVKG